MTNISTQKTTSQEYLSIYNELTEAIAKLNKKFAQSFLEELLTETERIMLVKRFGAVFMYSQNMTPYRVAHTLGISEPTASRLFRHYERGQYDTLLSCLTKKQMNTFLLLIQDLIAAQASPRARARLMNSVL